MLGQLIFGLPLDYLHARAAERFVTLDGAAVQMRFADGSVRRIWYG